MHSATLLFIPILFLASIQERHCQQQCLDFSKRDNLKAEPGSYPNFTFSISSSCYSPGAILHYVMVYDSTSHTLYCQITDRSCTGPGREQKCYCNPETREVTVRIYKQRDQNETWKVVAGFSDGSKVSETVHIGVNEARTSELGGTSPSPVPTTRTVIIAVIVSVVVSVVALVIAVAVILFYKRRSAQDINPGERLKPQFCHRQKIGCSLISVTGVPTVEYRARITGVSRTSGGQREGQRGNSRPPGVDTIGYSTVRDDRGPVSAMFADRSYGEVYDHITRK